MFENYQIDSTSYSETSSNIPRLLIRSLRATNKGEPALTFNLLYYPDGAREDFCFLVKGLRLMGGDILPPSTRFGGNWLTTCLFGKEFAEAIYEGLRRKLEEKEEFNSFQLNDLEDSIGKLYDMGFINKVKNGS